jgi:hypothetical protein
MQNQCTCRNNEFENIRQKLILKIFNGAIVKNDAILSPHIHIDIPKEERPPDIMPAEYYTKLQNDLLVMLGTIVNKNYKCCSDFLRVKITELFMEKYLYVFNDESKKEFLQELTDAMTEYNIYVRAEKVNEFNHRDPRFEPLRNRITDILVKNDIPVIINNPKQRYNLDLYIALLVLLKEALALELKAEHDFYINGCKCGYANAPQLIF